MTWWHKEMEIYSDGVDLVLTKYPIPQSYGFISYDIDIAFILIYFFFMEIPHHDAILYVTPIHQSDLETSWNFSIALSKSK